MWHGTHMWKSEDKKLGIQLSYFTMWVSLFKLQIEFRLGGKCLYLLGHLTDPCVAGRQQTPYPPASASSACLN